MVFRRPDSVAGCDCAIYWLLGRSTSLWLCLFSLYSSSMPASRRSVIALIPFFLFGSSYDWMNIVPNYKSQPVDVAGALRNRKSTIWNCHSERHSHPPTSSSAFTIARLWISWPVVSIFAGYRCQSSSACISTSADAHQGIYTFCNSIPARQSSRFAIYYIHPAAPPWYVALHGFEAIEGTPGDVAGLGRFDDMT